MSISTRIGDIVDGTSNTLLLSELILVTDTTLHDIRGRYFNSYDGNCLFSTAQPPNPAAADVDVNCIPVPGYSPRSVSATNIAQYARSYHLAV